MVFVLCGTPKYFPTIKLVFWKLGTIEISGKIILKYNEEVMLGLQELQIIQGLFLFDFVKWFSRILNKCLSRDRIIFGTLSSIWSSFAKKVLTLLVPIPDKEKKN